MLPLSSRLSTSSRHSTSLSFTPHNTGNTHTNTNTHVRLPSPILLNGITPPGIVQYCNATQAVTCCAFLAGPWSAITFGNAFGNACVSERERAHVCVCV